MDMAAVVKKSKSSIHIEEDWNILMMAQVFHAVKDKYSDKYMMVDASILFLINLFVCNFSVCE